MEYVRIFDTTLRDGEQSPGFSMNVEEKLRMAQQLARLNVDVIEAGFPISSPGDFEAVKVIAQEVRGVEVAGLARAEAEDIDRAWEALQHAERPLLHMVIATSDIHLKHKLRLTRDEVMRKAVEAVGRARSYTDNIEFSFEDSTRTDLDFLCEIAREVVRAGARILNLPDTVGYAIPEEYEGMIRQIRQRVPEIPIISTHCHDDLGLAVANSLAAVRAGARQVECTINGIGERAGNAALEEVVMALRVRRDVLKLGTRVVTEQIYPTSRLLAHITGVGVQPNKAVVGRNAFAHESGIHQDGVLKEKLTYEIMRPEDVGIPKSTLVLGKHSGRHAFRERLRELGYELPPEKVEELFRRFKELADKKKDVFDEDLEALVADGMVEVPQRYRLLHLSVVSGSVAIPTATVVMEVEGTEVRKAGFGDGPVDAALRTIAEIAGTRSRLVKYSVDSITGGTEAQGAVTVQLEEEDLTVVGRGSHTDIIMASAKAYVNALNRLEYLKTRQRRWA